MRAGTSVAFSGWFRGGQTPPPALMARSCPLSAARHASLRLSKVLVPSRTNTHTGELIERQREGCYVSLTASGLSRETEGRRSGLLVTVHTDGKPWGGWSTIACFRHRLQLEQLVWELPTAAARMGGEREISIFQLRRPV